MKAHSSTHLLFNSRLFNGGLLNGRSFAWSLRAALAVVAVSTTACGSGDDSTAAPADAAPDTTTTVPDTGTHETGATETGSETSVVVPDAGDGGAEAAALSFATDIYPSIIAVHCAGCHAIGTAADGGSVGAITVGHLDMGDAATAYVSLLGDGGGAPAQGTAAVGDGGVSCAALAADAGLLRVLPGNAAQSLICNKVASKEDGGPAVFCGNPMPLPPTGAPLDPALVQTIKSWINSGANP